MGKMRFLRLFAVANAAVKLDFTAYEHQSDRSLRVRDLSRRNTELVSPAKQDHFTRFDERLVSYLVEIEVGSNRDRVIVEIDPRSAHLVVFEKGGSCISELKNKEDKKSKQSICEAKYGSYDPRALKTYRNTSVPRSVDALWEYDDFTGYIGHDAEDDVTMGGKRVRKQTFLSAYWTNAHWGVLGISHQNESEFDDPSLSVRPNFLTSLRDQSHITKKLYSFYFANESASLGSLLIGGVDTAKIASGLTTLPLVTVDGYRKVFMETHEDLFMQVDGIALGNVTIVAQKYYARMILGRPKITLPRDLFQYVRAALGIEFEPSSYPWLAMACPANDEAKLVFDFGGAKIGVPLAHLVSPLNGTHCFLQGIRVDEFITEEITFGDGILRYAYTVVDLDAMEISIGPVKYTLKLNVVEVKDKVPMATRVEKWETEVVTYSKTGTKSVSFIGYPTGSLTKNYWTSRGEGWVKSYTIVSWVFAILSMVY